MSLSHNHQKLFFNSRSFCIVAIGSLFVCNFSWTVGTLKIASAIWLLVKQVDLLDSHKRIVRLLFGNCWRHRITTGSSFGFGPGQFFLYVFVIRLNGQGKLQILHSIFMAAINQLNRYHSNNFNLKIDLIALLLPCHLGGSRVFHSKLGSFAWPFPQKIGHNLQ